MSLGLHYVTVIRTLPRGTFVAYVIIQLGYMSVVTWKVLLDERVSVDVQQQLNFLVDLVLYYQLNSTAK